MSEDALSIATAAFEICDALLFKLVDLKLLTTNEAVEVLMDVKAVHASASVAAGAPELHQQVAGQIDRLVLTRAGSK